MPGDEKPGAELPEPLVLQELLLSVFAEAKATEPLQEIVVALEEIRKRLDEVRSHLTPWSAEAVEYVKKNGSYETADMRSVIERVLAERIDPAIRDLAAADPARRELQRRKARGVDAL